MPALARGPAVVVAICVALLASASTATAAVRLGPDLALPLSNIGYGCQGPLYSPCSFVNLHSTNADVPLTAPFNGVITRWRFRGGCCTDGGHPDVPFTLRVFKPAPNDGAGGYLWPLAVRTGPSFVVPAGSQITSDAVIDVPVRLRIDAGERAGMDIDYRAGVPSYSFAGVQLAIVQPATADGSSLNAYSPPGSTAPLNVEVEPDADGDGYGDDTQDCHPSDPSQQGDCVIPVTPSPPPLLPVYKPCPPGGCGGTGGGGGATFGGPIPAPTSNGDTLYIPVKCPPNAVQPCGGYLVASLPGAKKASASAKKATVLARVRYSVAPGATKKIKLKLSRAGRKLLARKGKLKAVLTLRPDGGKAVTRRISFKAPPAGKRHKR
jgi:hypothetical protein